MLNNLYLYIYGSHHFYLWKLKNKNAIKSYMITNIKYFKWSEILLFKKWSYFSYNSIKCFSF